MSDKPPSFTPTNPENGQFNNPESYAPRKLDKASRTTTPKTQIQRVSGEVDLSELQNKKLNYLKNSKKPKIKFTKNNFLKKRKPRWLKTIICLISIIIIFIISIIIWGNQLLHHEQALSKKADTSPAATYLIAGSDKRDKAVNDETQGGRSDTIMLLTLPQSGTPSLISVPRDTYTDIDGHGPNKLNAAYSFGGMKLMVKTIEDNFSIKIDHFIELGFDSMVDIVQSVGNLHLCLDYDVNDNDSGLKWKAGCHDADGKTALAFSRMRYSDPLSDIGRTLRQRQIISQLGEKASSPQILLNPFKLLPTMNVSLQAITVDENMNIFDLVKAFLGFKKASSSQGAHGTLPIKSMGYNAGAAGSVLLLDDEELPDFIKSLQNGTISPGEVGGLE